MSYLLFLNGCQMECLDFYNEFCFQLAHRLEELNLAWCDFTVDHVRTAVSHIPSTVIQLNLSGYRQNLLMSGEKQILA